MSRLNPKNDKEIVSKLDEVRSVSVGLQRYINGTCNRITNLMRTADFKLKEKKILKDKAGDLKKGKVKQFSIAGRAARLRNDIKKSNAVINRVMIKIRKTQAKLIKEYEKYNKKFVVKNKKEINNLLSDIAVLLKKDMSLSYFEKAYSKLIARLFKEIKNYTPKQFRNSDALARRFVNKHWGGILAKFKKIKKVKKVNKSEKKLKKIK